MEPEELLLMQLLELWLALVVLDERPVVSMLEVLSALMHEVVF